MLTLPCHPPSLLSLFYPCCLCCVILHRSSAFSTNVDSAVSSSIAPLPSLLKLPLQCHPPPLLSLPNECCLSSPRRYLLECITTVPYRVALGNQMYIAINNSTRHVHGNSDTAIAERGTVRWCWLPSPRLYHCKRTIGRWRWSPVSKALTLCDGPGR